MEHLRTISPAVLGLVGDVCDPEHCRELVRRTVEWSGRLDVLINNAGVIQVGPMQSMTEQDFQDAFDTHLWAPLHMTAAALPQLYRSDGARLVNIASIGGLFAVPHMLPYCASKFALVGLSQGMRAELKRFGIVVTTVCPGLMRTGSGRHAVVAGDADAEYAWFSILSALPGLSVSSSRAAQQILEGVRKGKAQVVITIPARVAARVHDMMPSQVASLKEWVNRTLPRPGHRPMRHVRGNQCQTRWPSWLTTLSDRAAVRNLENGANDGLA